MLMWYIPGRKSMERHSILVAHPVKQGRAKSTMILDLPIVCSIVWYSSRPILVVALDVPMFTSCSLQGTHPPSDAAHPVVVCHTSPILFYAFSLMHTLALPPVSMRALDATP